MAATGAITEPTVGARADGGYPYEHTGETGSLRIWIGWGIRLAGVGDWSGDQGEINFEARPAAGDGINSKAPAQTLEAFAHVAQTVPVAGGAGGGGLKAATVVFDQDLEKAVGSGDLHADLGGAGMFEDVGEGFFHHEEEVMPRFGPERVGRQTNRNLQAAANIGGFKDLIRIVTEVFDQAFEGIVLGIDGPDNFVEGLEQFT